MAMATTSPTTFHSGGDEEAIITKFAANPIMNRVQSTLLNQLKDTHYRVQRDFLEKQEELRQAKKEREDCGVELYGIQQQLAQQQQKLDSTGTQIEGLQKQRNDSILDSLKAENLQLKEKLKSLVKFNAANNVELGDSLETIRQARKYNQSVKSEAAVTRNVASKGQEIVKALQKEKQSQDLYIDDLNEKLRRLNIDIELYDRQLHDQKIQTSQTEDLLRETTSQLSLLSSEKKRLVQQWNSSLVALGKRDEALTSTLATLKDTKDKIKDQSSKLSSLSHQISEIKSEIETEALHHNRLTQENNFIEEQVHSSQSDQDSLGLQFDMFQKSLEKTQINQSKVELKKNDTVNRIASTTRKFELLTIEQKALEDQIGANKHDCNTLSQATINLQKEEKLLTTKLREKEIENAKSQKELARLKIDSLNTQDHNSKLQEHLNDEVKKLNEIDKEISKTETDINRRNSEIESKMNKIDRLNRKHEQMVNGIDEEEPLGPLEATIKHLQRDNDLEEKKIHSLQKTWITTQTTLVQTMSDIEGLQSSNLECSARLNILKHKKMRLLQEINANQSDLSIGESKMKTMHQDIAHLNELIGKYSDQKVNIENDTSVNGIEYAEMMKEMREDISETESKMEEVKQSKDETVMKLLDVERQILQWEKKIQLEKDTHAVLNSSEHINETKGMEKEIHRMKHKLELIMREEERLIRGMEIEVHKRENIAVKYQNAKHDVSKSNIITIADMKRKKTVMKKKLKENNEFEQSSNRKSIYNKEANELIENFDAATREIKVLNNASTTLSKDINGKQFEKQRLLSKSDCLKVLLQKLDFWAKDLDTYDGNVTLLMIEKDLAVSLAGIRRIRNVIAGLRIKHKDYDEIFERIDILASDIFSMNDSFIDKRKI